VGGGRRSVSGRRVPARAAVRGERRRAAAPPRRAQAAPLRRRAAPARTGRAAAPPGRPGAPGPRRGSPPASALVAVASCWVACCARTTSALLRGSCWDERTRGRSVGRPRGDGQRRQRRVKGLPQRSRWAKPARRRGARRGRPAEPAPRPRPALRRGRVVAGCAKACVGCTYSNGARRTRPRPGWGASSAAPRPRRRARPAPVSLQPGRSPRQRGREVGGGGTALPLRRRLPASRCGHAKPPPPPQPPCAGTMLPGAQPRREPAQPPPGRRGRGPAAGGPAQIAAAVTAPRRRESWRPGAVAARGAGPPRGARRPLRPPKRWHGRQARRERRRRRRTAGFWAGRRGEWAVMNGCAAREDGALAPPHGAPADPRRAGRAWVHVCTWLAAAGGRDGAAARRPNRGGQSLVPTGRLTRRSAARRGPPGALPAARGPSKGFGTSLPCPEWADPPGFGAGPRDFCSGRLPSAGRRAESRRRAALGQF
jgi:hypothetical protein